MKGETNQEEEIHIEKPQDLGGGGQEDKEPQITQEQEKMESIPTIKKEVSNIQL
jgi:hypothetical protein